MNIISGIVFVLTFLSVYVQVFFLITFLERKKNILIRTGSIELDEYFGVTIIVGKLFKNLQNMKT